MWKLLLIPRSPILLSVPIKSSSQESRQPTKHPQKFPFTDYDIPQLCNWLLPEYYLIESQRISTPHRLPTWGDNFRPKQAQFNLLRSCSHLPSGERYNFFYFCSPTPEKHPLPAISYERASRTDPAPLKPFIAGPYLMVRRLEKKSGVHGIYLRFSFLLYCINSGLLSVV